MGSIICPLFLYTDEYYVKTTIEFPSCNLIPSPKLKLFWLSASLLWQISRLIYTNSGNAILALASNAIHLLWKWQRNDRNSTGKVWGMCKISLPTTFSNHIIGNGNYILFDDIHSCRPLPVCNPSCGNLLVASWWLMTLLITIPRMPSPALLCRKMILM